MKPRVIPHMRSPAYVRGYIKGKVPGWRKERIAPGACLWIYWRVVAPVVRREIAGEKDTERKQEKGWLAGPDARGWPTAATGGSQQSALSGSHFKPPPLVEVLTKRAGSKDVISKSPEFLRWSIRPFSGRYFMRSGQLTMTGRTKRTRGRANGQDLLAFCPPLGRCRTCPIQTMTLTTLSNSGLKTRCRRSQCSGVVDTFISYHENRG